MASKVCSNCGKSNQAGARFCVHCGAALPTAPIPPKPGVTLQNGRYIITKQLGKGGMGATYIAKDTQAFDRPCVIKVMLPYFDPNDPQDFQAALRRFEQEAKALAELGAHPNIPNLLHWFEEGGQFFLVMEFIEGENLEEKLRREGVQSPEKVIEWGISLCKTLEFLAQKGYVHHDIKPANIILQTGSGEPILVDFGTVKAGKMAVQASFGTEGYAPPEQMNPPYQTEHRSDVFALAASLYHLLTNDHPAQNLWKFPKLPTIPQPLQDALREALNLDVRQRLTAREFREKLEQCLRPQPITGPFVSRSGQKVDKPEDWLDYAVRQWQEASEHLERGDLQTWLKVIGRFDLVSKAEDARKRHPHDQNAALQTFLESLDPAKAPKPNLQVNPTQLDFGNLTPNQVSHQQIQLTNVGKGYLFGEIVTNENWISVSPTTIGCLSGVSQRFQVTVKAHRLPLRGQHQGILILNTNGGTLSIPVKVKTTIAPELAKKVGESFGAILGAISGAVGGLAIGLLAGLLLMAIAGIVGVLAGGALGAAGAAKGSEEAGAVVGGLVIGAVIGYFIGALIAALLAIGASVGALAVGGIKGAQFGRQWGSNLGYRYGAFQTAMLLSALASGIFGIFWASIVSYGQSLQWTDAFLFITFIITVGTTLGGLLGAIAFWLTAMNYKEKVPSREKVAALVSVPIGFVLALFLWNAMPYPQKWWNFSSALEGWGRRFSSTYPLGPPPSTYQPSPFGKGYAPPSAVKVRFVQVAMANVREGPGTRFRVLTVVKKGTKVEVIGISPDGGWAKVRLPNGKVGYISRKLLGIAPPK